MFTERNIALMGFMTAGKTRVGRALAGLTGLPFLDVDALVEDLEGRPVHEIFRLRGEPYFRHMESAVLRDLCQGTGQIIGLGGGTILAEQNRRLLKDRCTTVWLQVSREEVLHRLENPGSPRRPLLEGLDAAQVVGDLLQAREPFYREADHAVRTDGRSIEEVAQDIAWRIGLIKPGDGAAG